MSRPCDLNEDWVGVESFIDEIVTSFNYGSTDVYTLGIWGTSGVGKTTIARAIFNEISSNFDVSYFVDVGKLKEMVPTFFKQSLSRKKRLIVIDNVTCFNQVKYLFEHRYSLSYLLMPGSLIIVTTVDKQVLESCGVKKMYELTKLAHTDALELQSRHAFRQNDPDVGYEKLSEIVIRCAQCIPIALKVLGHALFGKRIREWEDAVRQLTKISSLDVYKVLNLNVREIGEALILDFDSLNEQEQSILLYIVRFLNGKDRDHVIKILNHIFHFAERSINVLVDKGFISVLDNKISMHELLQEIGEELAEQRFAYDHQEGNSGLLTDEKDCVGSVDFEKMFVIINFVLELPSAVFEQLSSVHKPQYAILSISLSFTAVILSVVELVYRCRKEKITWKWRRTLPWLYYPSRNYSKPFGNFRDIIQLIGLVCAICQYIFSTITFDFVRRRADNPVQISFWPIVFSFGLLCSKFLEKH